MVYEGDYYDFVSGTTYLVTCASGTFTCSAAGGGVSIYAEKTLLFSSLDWQTLGNYQSAGSCSSITGKTVTVTGGTMRCKNQW